jgi:MFS family permease
MVKAPPFSVVKEMLRDRDFRRLITAQYIAQAADGLAQAAFAEVLVLDPLETGTPGRILALFALTLIPYSFIAPFMGVLVDRWPRRALMSVTNLIRGVMLVTLPLWSQLFEGDNGLYVGILALLGLGRLFLVTKGASLPVVLHEHHLLRGNAVSSGGGMISALAGGVLGIILVGLIDIDLSFVIAGVVYIASAAITRAISDPLAHAAQETEALGTAVRRVVSELGAGLRELSTRAGARIPLIGIFLLRVAGMLVAIGAILVIKSEFPDAGDRFGRLSTSALALGTTGLGAFLGAVAAPTVGRRLTKSGIMLLGFVVSGIGIAALGGIVSIYAVLALTFMGGLGGFLAKVSVDAQIQEALPDSYRGRGFAVYDIVYNLASVAAALVIVITQDASFRWVFVGTGIATLGLALAIKGALTRAGLGDFTHPEAD